MTTERTPKPGAAWEAELLRVEQVVLPQDDGNPFSWFDPPAATPARKPRRGLRRWTKTNQEEHRG